MLEGVPGARLSCVDLSPRMAEAARARLGERADVLLCDAERLPFRDGSFDAARNRRRKQQTLYVVMASAGGVGAPRTYGSKLLSSLAR